MNPGFNELSQLFIALDDESTQQHALERAKALGAVGETTREIEVSVLKMLGGAARAELPSTQRLSAELDEIDVHEARQRASVLGIAAETKQDIEALLAKRLALLREMASERSGEQEKRHPSQGATALRLGVRRAPREISNCFLSNLTDAELDKLQAYLQFQGSREEMLTQLLNEPEVLDGYVLQETYRTGNVRKTGTAISHLMFATNRNHPVVVEFLMSKKDRASRSHDTAFEGDNCRIQIVLTDFYTGDEHVIAFNPILSVHPERATEKMFEHSDAAYSFTPSMIASRFALLGETEADQYEQWDIRKKQQPLLPFAGLGLLPGGEEFFRVLDAIDADHPAINIPEEMLRFIRSGDLDRCEHLTDPENSRGIVRERSQSVEHSNAGYRGRSRK